MVRDVLSRFYVICTEFDHKLNPREKGLVNKSPLKCRGQDLGVVQEGLVILHTLLWKSNQNFFLNSFDGIINNHSQIEVLFVHLRSWQFVFFTAIKSLILNYRQTHLRWWMEWQVKPTRLTITTEGIYLDITVDMIVIIMVFSVRTSYRDGFSWINIKQFVKTNQVPYKILNNQLFDICTEHVGEWNMEVFFKPTFDQLAHEASLVSESEKASQSSQRLQALENKCGY